MCPGPWPLLFSGQWTDRDSEDLWLANLGWLARWREHHARSYAEVQDALKHAPTPWLSVKPPYLKRVFLATVSIWFTGTTNITSHRFYVFDHRIHKERWPAALQPSVPLKRGA
jgi:hypothetical protein